MDTVIGLLELLVYVVSILGLSMAITYAVVKISPSESTKQRNAQESAES